MTDSLRNQRGELARRNLHWRLDRRNTALGNAPLLAQIDSEGQP